MILDECADGVEDSLVIVRQFLWVVVVSCLVSDLRFAWTLEPLDVDGGTRISVHVDIPEAEAHRLDGQREVISAALTGLAALAVRS